MLHYFIAKTVIVKLLFVTFGVLLLCSKHAAGGESYSLIQRNLKRTATAPSELSVSYSCPLYHGLLSALSA